jgi:hypothetical protein
VTNEAVSIVSGGLLCLLGVLVLAAIMPSFAQYRSNPAQSAEPAAE